MKKCMVCGGYRTRLHTCVICGKKLCGSCSVASIVNGKRVCCYSDDATCRNQNRANHKALKFPANASIHEESQQ